MQKRYFGQCGLEVSALGYGAMGMKAAILGLFLILMGAQSSFAQNSTATNDRSAEQEIINLSKEKWGWMSEKKVDALANLFHEKAVFVH